MNNQTINEIKSDIKITDYVNNEVIPSKGHYYSKGTVFGKNKPIKCPLHDETSASFYYYADKNKFKCFGCDAYGDVIDLHMKLHPGLSFTEALTELQDKLSKGAYHEKDNDN